MHVVAALDVGLIVGALIVLLFVGSMVLNFVDKRRHGGVSSSSQRASEGLNSAGQEEAARDFGHGSGTYQGPGA